MEDKKSFKKKKGMEFTQDGEEHCEEGGLT